MNKTLVDFQEELTGALIGLARATEGNEHLVNKETDRLLLESLQAAGDRRADETAVRKLIVKVREEKNRLVPDCAVCASSCGRTAEYDQREALLEGEDVRSLKSLIRFGIRDIADYAYPAARLGYRDGEVIRFLYKALYFLGWNGGSEYLLPVAMETEEIRQRCVDRLEGAAVGA